LEIGKIENLTIRAAGLLAAVRRLGHGIGKPLQLVDTLMIFDDETAFQHVL
jgi:hypothetical protein